MRKYNIAFLIIMIFAVLGLSGCGGWNPIGPTPVGPTLPPPTITSISPASGVVGTVVTITGTNFSPVATNNIVKFNGVQAVVASATATVIVTSVPANASSGAITVTTTGGTATSAIFSVINSFKVTALDKFGNVAKGYLGTVQFLSSDLLALLPPNYTFTAADLGIANFSVFFGTTGVQTLTVKDTINPLIMGSTSVVVP